MVTADSAGSSSAQAEADGQLGCALKALGLEICRTWPLKSNRFGTLFHAIAIGRSWGSFSRHWCRHLQPLVCSSGHHRILTKQTRLLVEVLNMFWSCFPWPCLHRNRSLLLGHATCCTGVICNYNTLANVVCWRLAAGQALVLCNLPGLGLAVHNHDPLNGIKTNAGDVCQDIQLFA